jgi:hypothetical protein
MELAVLQREWGIARPRMVLQEGENEDQAATRAEKEWTKLQEGFNQRLSYPDWPDMITTFRVCLTRWAKQVGAEPLDDDAVALIVDGAENLNDRFLRNGNRAIELWARFNLEMLGPPAPRKTEDEEEDESPKVTGASTPNGSSPKASGGGSRSKRRGASLPTNSDSTPPPAESVS